MYHYAGNNPIKYTDPTGKSVDYDLGEISIEISPEDFIDIRESLKQKLESVNKAETWKEKFQAIFNAICGKAVNGVPLLGSLYDIYDGMNTLSTILSGMKEVDQQEALNQISDVLADYFSLTESTDKKPQVSIVLNIKASGKSEYFPGAVPAYSYCRNTVTEDYSIDFTLNGETKHIPLPKNTYNMPNTYIYPQKSFFPHF